MHLRKSILKAMFRVYDRCETCILITKDSSKCVLLIKTTTKLLQLTRPRKLYLRKSVKVVNVGAETGKGAKRSLKNTRVRLKQNAWCK